MLLLLCVLLVCFPHSSSLLFNPAYTWSELTSNFPESELVAARWNGAGDAKQSARVAAEACLDHADSMNLAIERAPIVKYCITLDPSNNEAIIELAFIHEELGDLTRAAAIFEHVSRGQYHSSKTSSYSLRSFCKQSSCNWMAKWSTSTKS